MKPSAASLQSHPPPQVQCPSTGYIISEIKNEYTRYIENFVLSAIQPETMVAAVAQKTVWKIRNPSTGSPSSDFQKSRLPKFGIPTKSPLPCINPKPTNQKTIVPIIKSQKFFIRMLAVFFERVNPASHKAKPGCMKNTSIAATSIHTVLIETLLSSARVADAATSSA